MASISGCASRGKSADRPGPCLRCGSPSWWNGWRDVAPVIVDDGEVRHATGTERHRACCSAKDCDAPSWTVREGDSYPHRTFQLEVVASVVAEVAYAGKTQTAAAAGHMCSRDSVRRWGAWIANLTDTDHLSRLCARIDPEGDAHAESAKTRAAPAGLALRMLDRFADLLVVGGAAIASRGCGLRRILGDQLCRFGDVFYLTKPSPPLRGAFTKLGM